MNTSAPTKLAIAIKLVDLETLSREYVNEQHWQSDNSELVTRLRLSHFLLWLQKRMETMNEHPNGSKNLQLVTPTD